MEVPVLSQTIGQLFQVRFRPGGPTRRERAEQSELRAQIFASLAELVKLIDVGRASAVRPRLLTELVDATHSAPRAFPPAARVCTVYTSPCCVDQNERALHGIAVLNAVEALALALEEGLLEFAERWGEPTSPGQLPTNREDHVPITLVREDAPSIAQGCVRCPPCPRADSVSQQAQGGSRGLQARSNPVDALVPADSRLAADLQRELVELPRQHGEQQSIDVAIVQALH